MIRELSRSRACFAVIALALAGACGDSEKSSGDSSQDGTPGQDGPDGTQGVDASTGTPDAGGGPAFVSPEGPWFPCGEGDATGATVVTAHDAVHQYWIGGSPDTDKRKVDAQATFPDGDFASVFMRVQLECPAGMKCDAWDRAASIALVEKEGDTERPIELARYMTPYAVGMCFMADVSEFAGRLKGTKTFRSFIDTWVGPGSSSGDGWQVTTTFLLRGKATDKVELVPLWNNQAEDRITDVGDPDKPLTTELPPRTVTIPADAKKVELRSLYTGHGQGNLRNCAEFCPLDYITKVGDQVVARRPWRPDCAENPVNVQYGTWQYARAGWCPGAMVVPERVDITSKVTPGSDATFSFAVLDINGTEFVNTCRPGAGDAENSCPDCVSPGANSCDYNSNGHTPPQARLSVQLVITR